MAVRRATPADLSGRTVVVTGASAGGIGYATAATLADWGATVIVTARTDPSALAAELGGGRPGPVEGHRLELTDAGSVRAFAAALGERPIDVLVNNAGVHLDLRRRWSEPQLTADGFEIHWRTNYLGPSQLTAALRPNLARAERARVVNVVSKLHTRATNAALFAPTTPYDSWVAYGASKLALIHHSTELTRRWSAEGIGGYALHPGSVYSHIADRGLQTSPVLGRIRAALAPLERRSLLSIDEGAQTVLHCATAESAEPGHYYRDCAVAAPSPDAGDAEIAARLWAATSAWIDS